MCVCVCVLLVAGEAKFFRVALKPSDTEKHPSKTDLLVQVKALERYCMIEYEVFIRTESKE